MALQRELLGQRLTDHASPDDEYVHNTGWYVPRGVAVKGPSPRLLLQVDRLPPPVPAKKSIQLMPWCTIPIEADCSLDLDLNHPIISPQGLPSSTIVFRILHPILASTLCDANPLARIAGPMRAL